MQQQNNQMLRSSYSSVPVASQYQGIQKPYQPVGFVQSQYGQNQGQFQSGAQSTIGTSVNAYHTANYRGNQPGHDNYLRSDSQNPSQIGIASFGSVQSQFQPQNQNFQQSQFASPQSYHLANYRGNQPGHDNYLRSDSQNPSQIGMTSFGSVQSQFQQQNQNFQQSQFGTPQSYHLANYRGNQPGHDNYLRSDSQQPSGSFAGFGQNNTGMFR
jgi:hypothetical protein